MRKTSNINRLLSLVLCICMVLSMIPALPVTVSAVGASTPVWDGNAIYARGTPLYIVAGTTSGTAIYYLNGSQKVYLNSNGAAGNDMSSTIIRGGYLENALDGDVNITMTGGKVSSICGTGFDYYNTQGGYANNVNITISGGTVTNYIAAGYRNPVKGNVNITMTGGSVNEIYGCCRSTQASVGNSHVKVHGNVNLRITGGSVSTVYSGDGYSPVSGTVSAVILVPTTLKHYGIGSDPALFCDNVLYLNGSTWTQKGSVALASGETLTVAAGQTLTLKGTLTNNGTIVNNGTVNMSGAWANNGTFINNGTLNQSYAISGNAVRNNGTVNYNAAYIDGISSVSSISAKMNGSAYTLSSSMYRVADGRLYVWLPSGNAEVTVNGSKFYGITAVGKQTALTSYVGVNGITGIPNQIAANRNYTLSASLLPETGIIFPQTVTYELVSSSASGTTLTDGVLYAAGAGSVQVRIVAKDSYVTYSTTVDIEIVFTPVTGLVKEIDDVIYTGSYTLPGVNPGDASYSGIVWTVVSVGTTGATISGNTLTTTGSGTLKLRGTVQNGLAYGRNYVVEKTVTVKTVDYIDLAYGSVSISKKDDSTVTVTYTPFGGDGTRDYSVNETIFITGTSTENHITVVSGNPKIALSNVNLNLFALKEEGDPGAFSIASGASVNLELIGTNTLQSGYWNAGLSVPSGASVVIGGDGALNAYGGANAAGIGGNNGTNCGTVTINSGTITAASATSSGVIGSGSGSGIGGGYFAAGGYITINGGNVVARGDSGIGSGANGYRQPVGTVVINGGTVFASGDTSGYTSGAGIGGGFRCSGYNVIINGGNVKVAAYKTDQLIGSGYIDSSAPSATPGTLTDGNGNALTLHTFTLDGVTDANVTAQQGLGSYGLNDVKTLDTNKLYFYLPANSAATSLTVDGTEFDCHDGFTYYSEHAYVATCLTPKTCIQCGVMEGKALGHSYGDGDICSQCGLDTTGVYHIGTAEQLIGFSVIVNAGYKTANAILEADIDLANVTWNVICETGLYYNGYGEDLGYAGIFDGNGHVIKNLKATSSFTMDASCGLFGTVSGTIKNLGIEGFTFVDGGYDIRVGAIVGQLITATGKVSNCYVTGATITPGAHVTGGIAGCVYDGTIENCYVVNSSINGTRYGYIVGDSRGDNSTSDRKGTVKNCYTDSTPIRSSNVGNITNCLKMTQEQFASGRVAYLLNGSVSSVDVVWFQTIGTDGYPRFTGDIVLYNSTKGYYNHFHQWEYAVDGYTINASCADPDGDCFSSNGGSVTIYPPDETMFTGNSVEAQVLSTLTTGDTVTVVYSGENLVDGKPVYFGSYTATITLGGQNIQMVYSIDCNHDQWNYSINEDGHLKYCVCGYSKQEGHSYNAQGECICGNACVHSGGTATCAKLAVCDTCHLEYGSLAEDNHADNTNTKITDNDDGTHSLICSECSHPIFTEDHQGGEATCIKLAVCEDCGVEYGYTDYYNHVGETYVEYRWYSYAGSVPNVDVYLYCSDCDGYIDNAYGEAVVVEENLPTDCRNPGFITYSFTCTFDGQEYTDIKTVEVKSDNHVGQFTNGFCSVCGGYEKPVVDPGEDPEWDYDDVYLVYNAGQLYWFADYVNNVNNGITGKLMADIDLNPGFTFNADGSYSYNGIEGPFAGGIAGLEPPRMWTPIGSGSPCYAGDFDGNGFTVSGAYAVSGDRYVGLFGNTDYYYTIQNLGITNSYFEGSDNVGGLIGYAYTTVKNCYVTDTVYVSGGYPAAALIGYNGGEVYNCYAMADTLVARDYGTITNCYYLGGEDTNGTTAMTAEDFASGKVAYLLQGGIAEEDIYDEDWNWIGSYTPEVWGQSIGTDAYPVLGGEKVYRITNCKDETIYSNTDADSDHSYDNACDAECNVCGEIREVGNHSFVNGGCEYCDAEIQVSLPGSFNGWNTNAWIMTRNEDGTYTYEVHLDKSTYSFKIMDDGNWLGNNGTIYDHTYGYEWIFGDGPDCTLSASGGTYTFTYNINTKGLKVAFVPDHIHDYDMTYTWADYYTGCTASGVCKDAACGDSWSAGCTVTVALENGKVTFTATCGIYSDSVTVDEDTTNTIYVDISNTGWTQVYVYCWNNNGNMVSWPGTKMEAVSGSVYALIIPDGFDSIIFNNGTGGIGNQTADLKLPTNGENIALLSSDISVKWGYIQPVTYTVKWDVGGTVTEQTYAYGETPVFGGSTDKAQSGCTVYTFAGWNQEIVPVTGDVTYTATYSESISHTEEVVTGYAPTCTKTGLTDGVKCSVCGEILTAQEEISATGEHIDADNSGRCDNCQILMQPAKFCFASISMEGNIALNYYTLLSDAVLADGTAYMQFTMADGSVIQIPISEGVKTIYNGETYYVFTCAVSAKEMTDVVKSQIFYDGGSTAENIYNVREYAQYLLGNNPSAKVKALIEAMINYGAASQIHFGYKVDNLINAGLTTPDYSDVTIEGFNAVAGQGTELAKFYSASLILKSETTLRFFFTGAITATYNGQELEVKQRGGLYYVDVVGIAAKDLDEAVTITINDGTTTAVVSFNPMSYCQGVLNDTTGAFDAEMKDLVAALYLYNQAANAYFQKEN